MKKNTKLSGLYLGIVFFLMYLPVAVVIIFSFNESRLPVRFTGFSLKWYQELLNDRAMIEALGNSLVLGAASCLVSAVIGTLGAVGLSRIHWKTKGALEYISILPLMIPEIILGMVLMAFFYLLDMPFGMLTLLLGHTVFCVPYILMEVKAWQIVAAAGGDADHAVRLMLADKMEELMRIQVDAVKGIKIDKVTVWDGGEQKDGKTATAGFVSGLMKSIPPMNEMFDMAGMELPRFLGKNKEEPAAPPAPAAEPGAPAEES